MHKTDWLTVGIMSFVIILILFAAGMMGPIGMRKNGEYSIINEVRSGKDARRADCRGIARARFRGFPLNIVSCGLQY
jgi:hypothetical protein